MNKIDNLFDIINFIDFFYTDNLLVTADRRRDQSKELQNEQKEILKNKLNILRDYIEKSNKFLYNQYVEYNNCKIPLSQEEVDFLEELFK